MHNSTAFSEAVIQYIDNIPPEKRNKDVIAICFEQNSLCTAETINSMLKQQCDEQTHRTSRAWTFFRRVVAATKDYEGIINNFGESTVRYSMSTYELTIWNCQHQRTQCRLPSSGEQ